MVTAFRREKNGGMTSSLQLATRIHFLLLRELGEGIRIERLLRDRLYGRDVLLVCDAIKLPELNQLAREFREAIEHKPQRRAAGGGMHQATPWAADTSGFGVSRPPVEPGKASEPDSPGWLESTWRWIGR